MNKNKKLQQFLVRNDESEILEYLGKFKSGTRTDFEKILLDKLPDVLDENQKKNKVKNNLQALRKSGKIEPNG